VSELTRTIGRLHKAYTKGKYDVAEMGVREALQTWPENANLLQLGVLTALAMNQVVTAHQRLDLAIGRTPMTAELANIQGRVYKASGDWAAAERAYTLSHKIDPTFTRAKVNLLNLLSVSEQPIRVLEELESSFDFGEMGEVARSQALTDLGQYEDALEVLRTLESETYLSQIIFQRIKCLASLGRFDEMMIAFEDLPDLSPMRAKALAVIVNYFEMRGHRDQSFELIGREIEFGSSNVSLQGIRLLKKIGRIEDAHSELKKLSMKHPDHADVLSEMASVARVSKKFEESCDLYTRALTRKPGDFSMLCGFAQAAISAGRFADAQTVLQAALQQSPNNQFLLALVATLLRETGQNYTHLYDYKSFVRVYDLSPPEGYSDIESFNADLARQLEGLHVYQYAPINQTLRSGTQTELDLSLMDDPVLNGFFEAIKTPIKNYLETLGYDVAHPLRRRNTNAYRISGAWSVRLTEKGHHVNHVHPMGWLSSAYYVSVPQNITDKSREGWIKFGEPDLDLGHQAEHFVQPKPGRLVLFPSYMWHGTIPFQGQETRLTLPFDVVPD